MTTTVSVHPGTPTTNSAIIDWVEEVAALTTPDAVVWCDGSDDEWRRLTTLLVDKDTFVRLPRKPNSFWCASDPEDVARVEDRTFICSQQQSDAGPTNNSVISSNPMWRDFVMSVNVAGTVSSSLGNEQERRSDEHDDGGEAMYSPGD
jgi:GTP-dependent phosphoenolpyruvate carboxykinase